MITSTTNLIQLQSGIKDHVKGQYEFRNKHNVTHTITKEMAGYSAIKSYLEKNISTILPFPEIPKSL
jgi:hypothetical protein